jgi:hypothetical protein
MTGVTTLTNGSIVFFTTGGSGGVCERYVFEKRIAGVRDIFDSVAYQVNCVKKRAISILSLNADSSLGRSPAKQVR